MKPKKSSANTHNRNSVNLFGVITTVVFLCVAIVTADVTFTTRIKDISKGLGRALNIILSENEIVYTNYTDQSVYVSNVEFHPKGMAGLYNITHIFMDFIQPKELFPKDVELTDSSGAFIPDKLVEQWPSLLRHYAGLLSLTILGLLFAALMPLAGFCFCCCRCCGRCGARSQPFDKKHDMCRKVFLAMFLIAVATLILFGVVCAFVSNQHLQDGVEELPSNVDNSLKDVHTFINSTNSHMGMILIKNYQELHKYLSNILEKTGKVLADDLSGLANASSFSRLNQFVTGLDDIRKNLTSMTDTTKDLRVKASQLNDGLRRVKHELLQTLNKCSRQKYTICGKINAEVGKLGTTVDFDSLPDVKKEVETLEENINEELINQIKKATQDFDDIPNKIQKEVDDSIPEIEKALEDTGVTLKNAYKDMNKLLLDVDKQINNNTDDYIAQANYYIKEYSIYRYYVGIGVSSILLLVILCVTFGLMCGICGKRPDGYDDDCCNKGAGSKFLMLGVAVMFLFSIVLMVVTLVYFLSGVVMQRLICDTLRNNDSETDNQVFKYLDKTLNIKNLIHSDIQTVINSCHANNTAYKVLRLDFKFNVSDIQKYMDESKIDDRLKEFIDKIDFKDKIDILNVDTRNKIEALKNSPVAEMPIHRFLEILETNLTSINLIYLTNQLSEVRTELEKEPNTEEYVMSIKQNEMYLRMYQNNLVEPMLTSADDLRDKALGIQEGLKFGEENFTMAVDKTLKEVENAQKFINDEGTVIMRELAQVFGQNFTARIYSYFYHVGNATENDIGQCGPLSNVYNQTLTATCDKILNPWNGFWVSVGWCLVLFIPTIVLSVKLSTLYQKSDPYPGPLVEHEYLYDAYADRDNIPLSNSSNGKKGKKKKSKSRVPAGGADMNLYQQQPSGSGVAEARSRDAPGGSSHPDTRYADMAPKHWEDYPNGGPPQYQSAPLATEYERPPPYYYPGPGDRP